MGCGGQGSDKGALPRIICSFATRIRFKTGRGRLSICKIVGLSILRKKPGDGERFQEKAL